MYGKQDRHTCGAVRRPRNAEAQRKYGMREGPTVWLSCEIRSVTWNESSISWLHTYPVIDKKLSDPVVDSSTVKLPDVTVKDSGDYTCLIESDGEVVLQYTITLNVICKYFTGI